MLNHVEEEGDHERTQMKDARGYGPNEPDEPDEPDGRDERNCGIFIAAAAKDQSVLLWKNRSKIAAFP